MSSEQTQRFEKSFVVTTFPNNFKSCCRANSPLSQKKFRLVPLQRTDSPGCGEGFRY